MTPDTTETIARLRELMAEGEAAVAASDEQGRYWLRHNWQTEVAGYVPTLLTALEIARADALEEAAIAVVSLPDSLSHPDDAGEEYDSGYDDGKDAALVAIRTLATTKDKGEVG